MSSQTLRHDCCADKNDDRKVLKFSGIILNSAISLTSAVYCHIELTDNVRGCSASSDISSDNALSTPYIPPHHR